MRFYHFHSLFVILVFLAIFNVVIWRSLGESPQKMRMLVREKKSDVKNEFYQASYFRNSKEKSEISLQADYLLQSNSDVVFKEPRGRLLSKPLNKLDYSAQKANYHKGKKILKLQGEVKLRHAQGRLDCGQALIRLEQHFSYCSKGVQSQVRDLKTGDKLFIDSSQLKVWWIQEYMQYTGAVKGRLERRYSFEPGVHFSAQRLDLYKNKLLGEFQGDVKFRHEGVVSNAGKAELFFDNYNKRLKYYVLYDDVRVRQRVRNYDGEWINREAFAEVMEAYARQRKIELKGEPRVKQNDDTVKGYKITLFLDKEMMEVDSSSSIINLRR